MGALSIAAGAAIVLAVWFLVQSLAASRAETQAQADMRLTFQIADAAADLLQAMTDAETGQRGYLLTGRKEFLRPYADAARRTDEALARLSAAAVHDPAAAAVLPTLRQLSRQRMATLHANLRFVRSEQQAEALVALGRGRETMDRLRDEVQQLKGAAEARRDELRERRRRLQRQAMAVQGGLVVANVLALAIAIGGLLVERSASRRAAALQAEVNEEIGKARRAAEEADRAKSRFLAAASHDMRQPLHALALYISALERRVEGEQAREILGNMDGAVRSMTRLFTALLDLARLEAGVLRPEPVDFAIGELLQEVADNSLDVRGRSSVNVVVAPTSLRVRTDPDLLEVALRNLASNAVKHSKGGRVLLGCRRVASQVRIEVWDDGEGIPQHELQGLFAEFVRGERAGATEGVGLGLAIVQRMARLLGHELTARSHLGRGSVFAVTVPRAAADAAAPAPSPASAPTPTLDSARILVADDDPLALDAMRRALADVGAEVTGADSAARVRALAAYGFDLYVFDMNLGDDDGLALAAELERTFGRVTPALIVTGATAPEALAALRSSGRAWLTKPLAAPSLAAAAAQLLGKAGR